MSRHTIIGLIIAIATIGIAWMLLAPAEEIVDSDNETAEVSDFGTLVAISDVTITLPAVAGNPAAIYFRIDNRGQRNIVLSEISLPGHGGRASFFDLARPSPSEVASIEVGGGRTLALERGDEGALFTGYDARVVPGAKITVRFRFANGEAIEVPAIVEAANGSTGFDRDRETRTVPQ